MRIPLLFMLLGSLSNAALAANDDNMPLYDGTWTVRVDAKPAGRLTVQMWEGTWQPAAAAHAACRGKKIPITIQQSTLASLELTAWGSKVSPACPDVGFTLEPTDERTLDGQTDAGGKVRMTRGSRNP